MTNKLELAATALRVSGSGALLRAAPLWRGLLVLNHHRIGERETAPYDRDVFSGTREALDAHVRFLKRNFDVIAPAQIEDARRERRGRFALITFDDGYRDNHDLALPVLRAHGIPATFFICTGFVDDPRLPWWDEIAWMIRSSPRTELPAGVWFAAPIPLPAGERREAVRAALRRYKQLPATETAAYLAYLAEVTGSGRADPAVGAELWMTWPMVRAAAAAGVTIGAHTVRHQLLARLSAEEQRAEIAGSRDRLTTELGAAPTAFAYPVGSRTAFTAETKRLLTEHGFQHAFAFYGGYQRFHPFDPLEIRRCNVGAGLTQSIFEAMTTLPGLFARW